MGIPPTAEWQPIEQSSLLIFVGVTGVGKSTTLEMLREQGVSLTLLPDRRLLTDQLIIGFLQRQAGETPGLVVDRAERFAITRRYRELFPGGMAHALCQLFVKSHEAQWQVFDGLRGANEVHAAAVALPQARFVVLEAPDVVRVERLLGRSDSFDLVAIEDDAQNATASQQTLHTIGLSEANEIFSPGEIEHLLGLCEPPTGHGTISLDDLRAKLKIVLEERRNYDPSATIQALQMIAPTRTLIIDTTRIQAKAAAQRIAEWLKLLV